MDGSNLAVACHNYMTIGCTDVRLTGDVKPHSSLTIYVYPATAQMGSSAWTQIASARNVWGLLSQHLAFAPGTSWSLSLTIHLRPSRRTHSDLYGAHRFDSDPFIPFSALLVHQTLGIPQTLAHRWR